MGKHSADAFSAWQANTDLGDPPPYPPDAGLGLAYLLWLFGGLLGVHRFYLGRSGSGAAMFLCTVLVLGLPVSFIWWLVDLFLLRDIYRQSVAP